MWSNTKNVPFLCRKIGLLFYSKIKYIQWTQFIITKQWKNLAKKLCNKKHNRVFWLLFSLTSSVMEAQIFAGYNRRFPQGNQWFLLLLLVMKKKNLNQTDLFLHTGCPSLFKKSALEQLIFSTGIGDNQAITYFFIGSEKNSFSFILFIRLRVDFLSSLIWWCWSLLFSSTAAFSLWSLHKILDRINPLSLLWCPPFPCPNWISWSSSSIQP